MKLLHLAALIALLLPTPGALGQDPGQAAAPSAVDQVIEWTPERKLSIEDFKGKLPASLRYGSRSWIKIETSFGCARGTLLTTVVATFDPSESWWRGSQWNVWEDVDSRRKWLERSRADVENKRNLAYSDADLLRHEQIHFDLAELTAARIRRRLQALQAVCADPGRDAIITKAVADINAEFRQEQARYDEETVHGTVAIRQRQWEERVERELKARAR